MSLSWLRFAELIVYAVVVLGLLGLAGYMVSANRMGEAFGSVITSLPVVIQAIGRIGQSQAMAQMADALAQSTPTQKGGE